MSRINYQQFYTDLQDKLIELYDTDPTKARMLKEIIEEVKDEQKPPVFSDEY